MASASNYVLYVDDCAVSGFISHMEFLELRSTFTLAGESYRWVEVTWMSRRDKRMALRSINRYYDVTQLSCYFLEWYVRGGGSVNIETSERFGICRLENINKRKSRFVFIE